MIVQFSRGGGQFIAGKSIVKGDMADKASVAGCVAGALQVRQLAELYGVPVILHTDHCMRDWLPWFDGLLEENEKYFEQDGVDNSDVDSSKLYTQPEEVWEVYEALSKVPN